jgi:hypothetical protein
MLHGRTIVPKRSCQYNMQTPLVFLCDSLFLCNEDVRPTFVFYTYSPFRNAVAIGANESANTINGRKVRILIIVLIITASEPLSRLIHQKIQLSTRCLVTSDVAWKVGRVIGPLTASPDLYTLLGVDEPVFVCRLRHQTWQKSKCYNMLC